MVVKKKDQSLRVCLDARHLNSVMCKEHVVPPKPEELLSRLGRGSIMSTVDMTSSYWQIPIKRDQRRYTGFVHNGLTYYFKVLPFGLSTAVSSFIRGLTIILGSEVEPFTLMYVDDLLIISDNCEQHLEHLKVILEKFRGANLTIKLRKSAFARKKVSFLGHIVSPTGIAIDPQRIANIQRFPRPRNIRELRGFLGLTSYCRRFCENFSDLTLPLLSLLKKSVKWEWRENQEVAFRRLKEVFCSVSIVAHPDFSKEFIIQCDSSGFALGGCLYQSDDKGDKSIIAFTSRTLHGSELSYTVTEKELLALVHCLRTWRVFILGYRVRVLTDHKSITFLLSTRMRNARLTSWVLFIQEYDLYIEHIPGNQNVIADWLSRNPGERLEVRPDCSTDVSMTMLKLTKEYGLVKENLAHLKLDQAEEKWIARILAVLQGDMEVSTVERDRIKKWYVCHGGILFRRGDEVNVGFRLCVPLKQVRDLTYQQHVDIGHFGAHKTYAHMSRTFHWPKMKKHVRQVIAGCDVCQKTKISPTLHGAMNSVLVDRPGVLVCVDLMGPLPPSRGGVVYLLAFIDSFSKHCRLYALKRATTRAILDKLLKDYVPNVQKPNAVLSDNGTQFRSREWSRRLGAEGILVKFTSTYYPQGNQTERLNREIGRLLRVFCHENHKKWSFTLEDVEMCINNVVHESTGFCPNMLQFGRMLENNVCEIINFPKVKNGDQATSLESLWVLASSKLKTKAQRRKAKHDSKVKLCTLNVGDAVLVRSHQLSKADEGKIKKLFALFEGPFYISKVVGPNSYEISYVNGEFHSIQNIVNLKIYNVMPSM
nr:unnamed protein product [Callosobruchus chinensis]